MSAGVSEQILLSENQRLTEENERLAALLQRPVNVTVTAPPPPMAPIAPATFTPTPESIALQAINATLMATLSELKSINERLASP